MKSRELHTIHDLIVTDYTITKLGPSRYRHSFHPATTNTQYEFEANVEEALKNGHRYNIGFTVDSAGKNIVDPAAISPTDLVNPLLSYAAAQSYSKGIETTNKANNDTRVTHGPAKGYYWGKKYAWRRYGLVIGRYPFDQYLEEIGHPSITCQTGDPDAGFSSDSTAYADAGLQAAIDKLISTAVPVGDRYFKSPHYSKKFSIRGLSAITDKK
jgi:hypothetical protein